MAKTAITLHRRPSGDPWTVPVTRIAEVDPSPDRAGSRITLRTPAGQAIVEEDPVTVAALMNGAPAPQRPSHPQRRGAGA